MKRICFVHAGLEQHGGIGRVVSIIANGLSRETDIEVVVVSFCKETGRDVYVLNENIKTFNLFDSRISMKKALLSGGIGRLSEIVRDNSVDVIIACGALYYPLVVCVAKLSRIKSVCWEHTNPEYGNDYKFQKYCRAIGAKHSDVNVLIAKDAVKYYCKKYRVDNNRLIYNPADELLFKKTVKYNTNSRKIVSVGRLSYPKNYMCLLDVAKNVLQKNAEWSWDIYGDGEDKKILEDRIVELGLTDRVTLKGNSSNMYSLYDDYAIMVMTSRYEGFPMVLIEAASRGLPLVSFDIHTGPNEIIVNGVNGYLINKGDVVGMSEKISLLIQDCALRRAFSQEAIKSVERFREQQVIDRWIELIKELD